MISGFHAGARGGEPLFVVRSGVSNPGAVMAQLSHEQVVDFLLFSREQAFLQCDRETRQRRRLVKMVTVIHMEHASANVDRRFFQCLAASGKIAEFVYPQQLMRSVMFRPPSFFFALFALFKPLMSAKQLEKNAVCPGRVAGGSAASCPFASKHFDVAALPTILGGECTCAAAGGCFCGVANTVTEPKRMPGEKTGWFW